MSPACLLQRRIPDVWRHVAHGKSVGCSSTPAKSAPAVSLDSPYQHLEAATQLSVPPCQVVHVFILNHNAGSISPGFKRPTSFSFYGQLPWESMKECIERGGSSMLFLLTYGCWPGINVEKRGWHSTAARFDCWRDHSPIRARMTSSRRGRSVAKNLVTLWRSLSKGRTVRSSRVAFVS